MGGFFSGSFLGGGGRLAGCLGRAGGDLFVGVNKDGALSSFCSAPSTGVGGSCSLRRLGCGGLVSSPDGLIGEVTAGGLLGWGGAGFRGAAAGGLLGG